MGGSQMKGIGFCMLAIFIWGCYMALRTLLRD
jgi:hypothetical protein